MYWGYTGLYWVILGSYWRFGARIGAVMEQFVAGNRAALQVRGA